MKKSTVFITTFVLLAVFIGFGAYYAKVYKPAHAQEASSSVYVPEGMNREKTGNRVLLAELKADDIQLYQDGGYTILVHSGHEAEFNNWTLKIKEETPQLYYIDFDEDGKKEVVVRALEGTDEKTGENYYCIYVVFITQDKDGNYKYEVVTANRATWYSIFNGAVQCEANQPVINSKRIQFVMQTLDKSIAYNVNTGIVQDSRAWYIRALADDNNNYYTFKSWYLGPAVLDVDTENNYLSIHMNLYITYKETEEIQTGGLLNCGLAMEDKAFSVAKKSVTFVTAPEYRTTSLLKLADKDWNYTFINADSYSSSDKIINKTSFRCTMQDGTAEENTIFSGTTDETKAIDRIVLDKNTMKLYAKAGYSFAPDIVSGHKYSVTVRVGGYDSDITLSASSGDENRRSVITFELDKDYPQEELKNFTVNLG